MADNRELDEENPEIELLDLPYLETIEIDDNTLLCPDVGAYWFLIYPEQNVYRFLYVDDKDDDRIEYTERFRPILLIHGFKSSHLTWSWMAQQLWADGFRNIFAMELFSYSAGIQNLFDQLTHAINQILTILPNYQFVTIIGHSLGGLVSRYYLKNEQNIYSKVRLCVTLGSPHYGVFPVLKPFMNLIARLTKSFIPSQMETVKTFRPEGRTSLINKAVVDADVYTSTMINIAGSLPKLGWTDGLFKPKPIHDMVNLKIPSTHFNINKISASYEIILKILLNRVKIFKLRLLYIETSEDDLVNGKEYFFRFCRKSKEEQRYPMSGYMMLTDQILIPKKPQIVYVGMGHDLVNELISIQIFQKKTIRRDPRIAEKKIQVQLGSVEKKVDYFVIKAEDNTKFAFAIFTYFLKHTYSEEDEEKQSNLLEI